MFESLSGSQTDRGWVKFPRCAGISPADTLAGSRLAFRRGRKCVASATHADIVMYRYIEFCFIQFWSIFSLLPLSSPSPPSLSPSPTSPLGFPLSDADGSCLFPDAQTLFNVSLNNSALIEIFNIACWSPLGAVDGLLFEIGVYIYESWPDGAEERACDGVNKWKTELEKEAKIKKKTVKVQTVHV